MTRFHRETHLNRKSQVILDAIMRAVVPPTVRELGTIAGGLSTHGVQYHVERLHRLGLISLERYQARTYRACVRFIPAEEIASCAALDS